jgi:hypothetical protein
MFENILPTMLAFALDAGSALPEAGKIAWHWLAMIPAGVMLFAIAAMVGLTLPLVAYAHERRSECDRRWHVRMARIHRSRARSVKKYRTGKQDVRSRPAPSPATLALELVRHGVAVTDVCRRTRLSIDAVSLLAIRRSDRECRNDRPGAAALAGSGPGARAGSPSPAAT